MYIASSVLIALSLFTVCLGLIPCFGWLNWVGVPASVACAVVGAIGLATDKGPDGSSHYVPLHTAAIVIGVVMGGIGVIRCSLGSGLF
ncbi:MAG: hypothetical protein O7A09_00755 [Proteobacteria bacterium]|nr:hypothetical protein [Pseudomonadota bacterium]